MVCVAGIQRRTCGSPHSGKQTNYQQQQKKGGMRLIQKNYHIQQRTVESEKKKITNSCAMKILKIQKKNAGMENQLVWAFVCFFRKRSRGANSRDSDVTKLCWITSNVCVCCWDSSLIIKPMNIKEGKVISSNFYWSTVATGHLHSSTHANVLMHGHKSQL